MALRFRRKPRKLTSEEKVQLATTVRFNRLRASEKKPPPLTAAETEKALAINADQRRASIKKNRINAEKSLKKVKDLEKQDRTRLNRIKLRAARANASADLALLREANRNAKRRRAAILEAGARGRIP